MIQQIQQIISTHHFYEFAAILIVACIVGIIGKFLRQPLIISFIAVGIIVGPSVFNLIHSTEQMDLLAEVGIALLLFVVGLKLDLSLIKSSGKVALLTGSGQILATSIIGFGLSILLGYSMIVAGYVAVALTFSSTIIIIKLLSDKKEIDSLYGQIAVGILIVQDIVVVFAMIILSALGAKTEDSAMMNVVMVFVKGFAMIGFVLLLMKYVIPVFVKTLANSLELLVLFAISWAIALSAIGDFLGFSKEVGAFLAGISLASTPFRDVISGRLVTLRDFLLLFFFINLGAHLDFSILGAQILPAILLSVFVLIGKPIIIFVIMGILGYRKRTTFLTGFSLAQISEFSLILVALGLSLGHINDEIVGLITLVGLITIGLSSFMILYSHKFFDFFAPFLSIFERKHSDVEADKKVEKTKDIDVIIFGLGRYGDKIAQRLMKDNYKVLGINFDPKVVDNWHKEKRLAQYGDAEDPEITEHLPLKNSPLIISSVPDLDTNLTLLKKFKLGDHSDIQVALTAHTEENARLLKKAGADFILLPFADAPENITQKLENYFGRSLNGDKNN